MPPAPDRPLRTLRIRFRLTSDPAEDVRRLDALMQLLESHPGEDPFSIEVLQAEETLRLRFPNRRTRYSSELVTRLRELLGDDALVVER